MADAFLQHAVGRQPDRVIEALGFQELVNLRVCKGGIGAEIEARDLAPIARHDWFEHVLPAVGTSDFARTQRAPFEVTELVEQEQRMIAETMGRSAAVMGPSSARTQWSARTQ